MAVNFSTSKMVGHRLFNVLWSGCRGMELFVALKATASSKHNETSFYLLGHVHHQVLNTLDMDILKVLHALTIIRT
jgi:hypothetical protein